VSDNPETKAKSSIFGANPLLEGLSPYATLKEMPKRLINEPLKKIDWKSLRPAEREPLLGQIQAHFFPTTEAVSIAMAVQNAMFETLRLRDPRDQAERVRLHRLLTRDAEAFEARMLPLECPVSGGIIMAETGMGKSATLRAALRAIAPNRIIHHSRSEECGWAQLYQVPYLMVDIPANDTPRGLAYALAESLDSLLGSNYCNEIRQARNVDAALVLVNKFLQMHRVGFLVIDESQADSYDEGRAWGKVFIRYFKRLLNFGIPVMLSGHPDAFSNLKTSAQLARRFTGIGQFELVRATDPETSWWKRELSVGVMRASVVDRVENPEEVREAISKHSTGVPAAFSTLWTETQRIALRRDQEQAVVSAADIGPALSSPGFRALAEMTGWLASEAPEIGRYQDLKASQGTPKDANDNSEATCMNVGAETTPDSIKKLKALEEREIKRLKKIEAAIQEATKLDEEDLRRKVRNEDPSDDGSGLVQSSLDLSTSNSAA
jgi:hypothetical protein